MSIFDFLKQSAESLWSHKLRSFLTLLCIVISITSVVTVSSIIEGFNRYFEEKLANLGTRLIYIERFSNDDFSSIDSFMKAGRFNKKLDEEDYFYLREKTTSLEDIGLKTPAVSESVKKETLGTEDVSVFGSTANLAEIEKIEVGEGRFFSGMENESGKRVAFIGSEIANDLTVGESVVGKTVKIGSYPYEIIGVAVARGSFFGQSQDRFAVLPLKTFKRDFGDVVLEQGLSMVAKSRPDVLQSDCLDEIRFWMRKKRLLTSEEKDTFGIHTMNDVIAARDRIYYPILFAAFAIPAIVLFIGSTIVMNVMLVSVTERTKEIGIRKSVGATKKNIVMQFLTEALLICLIGGFFGTLFAGAINLLISDLVFPISLSLRVILTALLVSTTVGIVSGLLPALKAASLNPITALNSD